MKKKKIICLSASADSGKTKSIRELFIRLGGDKNVLKGDNDDFCEVVNYNNVSIGFVSLGDPYSKHKEQLEKIAKSTCKIIVTASRTRGRTVTDVEEVAKTYDYEVIRISPLSDILKTSNEELHKFLAECNADSIKKLTERIIKKTSNIMNMTLKMIILFAIATFTTFTAFTQTDELWLDEYNTIQIIDTVTADSIETAMNMEYNAELKEREFQRYAHIYLDKIAIIDKLVEAEKENLTLSPNSVLYANLKLFEDDDNTTKKDLRAIKKYKVPKGFSERVLLPTRAIIQNKIDQFKPPIECRKYNWRDGQGWNKHNVPIKEVKTHTLVPNPECRDNYFNGNLSPIAYDYSWDKAQQSKDWEWVKADDMKGYEEFFPEKISYLIHPAHPEYRFKLYGGGCNAYDKQGKLVRVDNIIGDYYSIKKDVMHAICIRDFFANKYDINKATKETLKAIRIQLGIGEEHLKLYKNLMDANNSKLQMELATSQRQYSKASSNYNKNMKNLTQDLLVAMNRDAYNYIKQLESDNENKLQYLYKIERIDNTTFKLYYLNDKMECGCIALMKWSNKAPYECKYQIELLPNEIIPIKR